MELIVKNKLISWGGSSTVTTTDGKEVYKVKGKVFSITKKKWVCDMEGNKLFLVRNKYWKFFKNKALIYDDEKNLVCMLVNNLFTIKKAFTVEKCASEIEISNQKISFGYNWPIIKDGKEIGSIGCDFKLVRFVDEFKINVIDEKEAPFLIALAIALDNIRDKRRERK